MSVIVFVVIGGIVSLILVALAIFTGYVLYGKYTERRNNLNISTPIQEIHCDDIKATAITLSQNRNEMDKEPYHLRKRSQSDPDILLDSVVAVAIESPDQSSPDQNSPESAKSEITAESTESLHTDDDFEQSVSPLSSPNSQSNCQAYENALNRHHRSRVIPEITEVMIQEAITILDETTGTNTISSSLKVLSNDINQVINTIDDDEEEEKDEEQEEESRVAITRMIIGPDVRIVSDESRSSVSIPSTNLSYSTDESQYAGFMKKYNNNNDSNNKMEEKKSEEDEIINNSDDNEDVSSSNNSTSTITYDNSNNDYNNLHGIKAVGFKNSPFNQTLEKKEIIIQKSPNIISNRLSKLSEADESQNEGELIGISDTDIDDDDDDDKLIKKQTPHLKQKITKYKQNIKNLEESSGKTQRRQSVAALKLNRVVKSRRPLFENLDNSSS